MEQNQNVVNNTEPSSTMSDSDSDYVDANMNVATEMKQEMMSDDFFYVTDKDPQLPQPKKFSAKKGLYLKPHQLSDIYAMKQFEKRMVRERKKGDILYRAKTKIGVLGEKPGSGKTLTILGLIYSTAGQDLKDLPLFQDRRYEDQNGYACLEVVSQEKKRFPATACTVVVVPNNLFSQWQQEIEKVNLTCHVFKTSDIEEIEEDEKDEEKLPDVFTRENLCHLRTDTLQKFIKKKYNKSLKSRMKMLFFLQEKECVPPIPAYEYIDVIFDEHAKMIPHFYRGSIPAMTRMVNAYGEVQPEFKGMSLKKVSKYDIMLVKATHYNEFALAHQDIMWKRLVIDEADSIKISKMVKLEARFTWIVTATFMHTSSIRRVGMLRDMMRGMNRDIITNIVIISDPEYIKESMKMPDITYFNILCESSKLMNEVRNLLTPGMQQMLDAGDIQGVISALKGEDEKVSDKENLADVVLANLKKEIKEAKAKLTYYETKQNANTEAGQAAIKKIKDTIASLSTRRESLKENIDRINSGEEKCCICTCEMENPVITDCLHSFCGLCLFECIKKSGDNSCPICRHKINMKKLDLVKKPKSKQEDDEKEEVEEKKPSKLKKEKRKVTSKVNTVLRILEDNPEDTFLVFTCHEAGLKAYKQALEKAHVPYGMVCGTNNEIAKTITQLQRGDIRVVLFNSLHSGAGIDVKTESHVIMTHRMEKSLEEQSVKRCFRLGRKTAMKVYYLMTKNEAPPHTVFANKDDIVE